MSERAPSAELDKPFSDEGAEATKWSEASDRWETAGGVLALHRASGRPTSCDSDRVFVWQDETVYFATGPGEQKAKNLEHNNQVVVTTGCNKFRHGVGAVIEGEAVPEQDSSTLERLAEAFANKYDDLFGFQVRDDRFLHMQGGMANVFRVEPAKGFAYGRGNTFSATRYRF